MMGTTIKMYVLHGEYMPGTTLNHSRDYQHFTSKQLLRSYYYLHFPYVDTEAQSDAGLWACTLHTST